MTRYLLYLYAESPVHTGAANSADVLDLPVQREAATGYPVIWGQSLKGALRQSAQDAGWGTQVSAVFGSDVGDAVEGRGTTPGSLTVGDAQLVAMPVPALRRTFAWVTSEIALSRLARKYKILRHHPALALPSVANDQAAAADGAWTREGQEVLGPCLVPVGRQRDDALRAWAERIAADALEWDDALRPFGVKFREDLILTGCDLVGVLLRECTEQTVRVQLDKDKTVANGPFYSEYLPAETIMAAVLTLRGGGDVPDIRQALTGLLDQQLLQIGGDETIGKGLMWGRLIAETGQ